MSEQGEEMPRARFLKRAGAGIAATALAAGASADPALAAGGATPPPAADTPAEALTLLKTGNQRYMADKSTCGPLTPRRLELTQGQAPFAIVLGCSDSRVPIETIFDQVPGHIFAVRLAGNFVDDNGLGSIEYGVAVLHAKLILVLGHGSCGAVDSTLKLVKDGTPAPGHIAGILTAIEPAVKATKGMPGDWLNNAIAENVKQNAVAVAARSTIVSDAIKAGKLNVVGGVYHLHTGEVSFL